MLVHIVSFGSNWWARYGHDTEHRHRFSRHACYYNSTGILCGRKVRRHWMAPGLIRFNGAGDFNPHFPDRALNQTFHCAELTYVFGGNRLLFERKASRESVPDCYLVAVQSSRFGCIDPQADWKSPRSVVVAVSQLRDEQEVMLLMMADDWISTSSGIWRLSGFDGKAKARLEFQVEEETV